MNSFESLTQAHPLQAPSSLLAWEAVVQVSPRQDLGMSPAGERFIIPIVGGQFAGQIDSHVLRGRVLPGGPAAEAGLREGDGVLTLEQSQAAAAVVIPVMRPFELSLKIIPPPTKPIPVTIFAAIREGSEPSFIDIKVKIVEPKQIRIIVRKPADLL